MSWVDAHANLPTRARWTRESGCGSLVSKQAGSVGPLSRRAFLFQSVIDPATVQAYRETHYCVRGPSPLVLRIGQHPSNSWAGEESFLVFGVSLEAAKALGRRFEQNAIVWSAADAVPQLILLR